MKFPPIPRVFQLLLVAAAVFVWLTGIAMPPVVASHFALNGFANGFMPRSAYIGVMMLGTIVVPLLVARTAQATLISLSNLFMYLASAILVFMCFVHWLIVRANESQPPQMEPAFGVASLVFIVGFTGVWLVVLHRRFRQDP